MLSGCTAATYLMGMLSCRMTGCGFITSSTNTSCTVVLLAAAGMSYKQGRDVSRKTNQQCTEEAKEAG